MINLKKCKFEYINDRRHGGVPCLVLKNDVKGLIQLTALKGGGEYDLYTYDFIVLPTIIINKGVQDKKLSHSLLNSKRKTLAEYDNHDFDQLADRVCNKLTIPLPEKDDVGRSLFYSVSIDLLTDKSIAKEIIYLELEELSGLEKEFEKQKFNYRSPLLH